MPVLSNRAFTNSNCNDIGCYFTKGEHMSGFQFQLVSLCYRH